MRFIISKSRNNLGFTLIEVILVIAIIATLSAIAVPMASSYIERAKIMKAISEIRVIQGEITQHLIISDELPATLAEIGLDNMLDPYGNPYQYAPSASLNKGEMRKDRNLVPVNDDYDLYSMGADGKSVAAFTAKDSWDDIVRASNGSYVGLASGY